VPFNKKKGSKKKNKSSAKGKLAAAADGGGPITLKCCTDTDEELFGLGHESYSGEGLICMLPMPSKLYQAISVACCAQRICPGGATGFASPVPSVGFSLRTSARANARLEERSYRHECQLKLLAYVEALLRKPMVSTNNELMPEMPTHATCSVRIKVMSRTSYQKRCSYRDGDWRAKKEMEKCSVMTKSLQPEVIPRPGINSVILKARQEEQTGL